MQMHPNQRHLQQRPAPPPSEPVGEITRWIERSDKDRRQAENYRHNNDAGSYEKGQDHTMPIAKWGIARSLTVKRVSKRKLFVLL